MQNGKRSFKDFIGNEKAIERIRLLVGNKNKVPHMLFLGFSGHGKSAMSRIVADELDRHFCYINCVAIKSPLAFREAVMHPDNTAKGAIIMLDEAHTLPKAIQDNMLSMLEWPAVLVTCYKNQLMRDTLQQNITFVLATNYAGNIDEALHSRLEQINFQEYSSKEKSIIAIKYLIDCGQKVDNIDAAAIHEIAIRARSPREVKKSCDNMVRYINQRGQSLISLEVVEEVFKILDVDGNGLLQNDRILLGKLNGAGHVGVETLAAMLHLSKKELETKIEPYLLRKGLINRTSSGRAITSDGIRALRGERVIHD